MSQSYLTNGNVRAARAVKIDTTTAGGYVVEAGAGDRAIGVSQPGVRQPPLSGLDDGFAGVQNVNQIVVFTVNDECWLVAGGAITVGDLLKSDSSARGVTASSDGDIYFAEALEAATAANQLIRVRIVFGYRGA